MMAARPRERRRRDWPAGLREPRPGYFYWRDPVTGKDMPIGRVTLARAKQEAGAANDYRTAQRPHLLEQLTGAANTVAQLLEQLTKPANTNTAKSVRSLDKKIKAAIGHLPCGSVTTKHCADLLEAQGGMKRTAQALRSRLVAIFAKGQAKGWLEQNPAEPTETDSVKTKRQRLTLEQFKAVLARADEVNEWLRGAMLLGVVSGLDRSTLSSLRLRDVGQEYLTVRRGKTKVLLEIPLVLRLEALGLSLSDALAACRSSVRSMKYDYVIHHAREFGNAPRGSKVHPDTLSHAFAQARELAGIKGDHPPTFHELRSLCKRLYLEQGGVDTRALLGHLTEEMSALYADPRGAHPIRVKLG